MNEKESQDSEINFLKEKNAFTGISNLIKVAEYDMQMKKRDNINYFSERNDYNKPSSFRLDLGLTPQESLCVPRSSPNGLFNSTGKSKGTQNLKQLINKRKKEILKPRKCKSSTANPQGDAEDGDISEQSQVESDEKEKGVFGTKKLWDDLVFEMKLNLTHQAGMAGVEIDGQFLEINGNPADVLDTEFQGMI